ncbi:sigma 54 modulation/S30EA ribosomal C-terminal domain-containing protein [Lentzea sp. HUAS12]|uniref:sigma 54 modulation/S30EA ribosomal C-terminal domain-containing protein n=1 Tax=Lentzea sp. HUAS12 TaxID=2951806 RepID=UPI0020A1B1D5|nr:sigma 54 modulation/S30EA ribosomal C-terminal domain-containing protein [Lentzea sp. HUAS12]USX54428.1 sigma 54 modulation/S30EA ribosomal C-terminal domain-containing protein [Lentzea sp. HUAS12]
MSGQVASVGEIAITTAGQAAEDARELVRSQVAAVLRPLRGRWSAARIRLTADTSSGASWPALAQVNLVADGRPVRVQAGTARWEETGALIGVRLGEQLARLDAPWRPRRWPEPGRRGRPRPQARPAGQREVVRRKEVPPARRTPDEAALTMDLMDFDAHLFVDGDSGQDGVVYRIGPTGYRMARLGSPAPPATPPRLPLTFTPHPIPDLSGEQAVHRLTETEYPFLFYRDLTTGRGHLLYHRYDGHYGLIAPI